VLVLVAEIHGFYRETGLSAIQNKRRNFERSYDLKNDVWTFSKSVFCQLKRSGHARFTYCMSVIAMPLFPFPASDVHQSRALGGEVVSPLSALVN
jgi:hypothetical protein